MMEGYIGRGRGIATNVPESELIEQVKLRPLLYDKNVKDYRKSDASNQAWTEVANILQTNVSNCRKRWKSLRDTFIKYYRLDVMKKSEKRNRKNWVYYKDLSFLIPHVDLYRLDDGMKINDQQHNGSIPIYLEKDFLEADQKHIFYTEEHTETDDGVTYQIKIAKSDYDEEDTSESIEDENLLENNYVEERLDDSAIIDLEEQVVVNKVIQKLENDEHMLLVQPNEDPKETEYQCSSKASRIQPLDHIESSSSSLVDPDERYLLSCLPAFKRLTPKQKGRIRIGIEKLFFEVEFQSDDESPKRKKFESS